jgi:nitrite reductase/ring-hydroxylating ferredoxin subunit
LIDGPELLRQGYAQGGVDAVAMPVWRLPGIPLPTPGHAVRVTVDGVPVAVFRVGDRLFALDAKCTHVGGPLDKGPVAGGAVTCPLHGSQFDLASGQVLRGPAVRPVRAFRVREEADALVLETD